MAISEAVEDAASRDDTKYSLGSVLNHVLLHQTVIGQEAIEQMGMAGESPDVIIGCTGGGSNFAGLTFPFLGRNFREGAKHRVIAVEPEAAPSLTRGVYAYDFGDTGKLTPLVKMHTLGYDFIPEPIHAGGLRYHGMAPLVSLLKEHGFIEARSVHQRSSFEAGVAFARAEGILPAPEPTHAIRVAIDEARAAQGGRRAAGHPVQPVRPRALRPVRVRALPGRLARGLRVPGREGRGALAACPASAEDRRPCPTRLLEVWAPDLHRFAAEFDGSATSVAARAAVRTSTTSAATSSGARPCAGRTRRTIPDRRPKASGARRSAGRPEDARSLSSGGRRLAAGR